MNKTVALAIVLSLGGSKGGALDRQNAISPDDYLAVVKYLASPELKGRRTGTAELEKASAYLQDKFKRAGLKPLNNDYSQQFEVTAKTSLGAADNFSIQSQGETRTLQEQSDFIPLSLSSNGSVHGGLVFAGYGITAHEYRYDDYKDIDAKDKVVLVLRHEPQENDDKSVFAGKNYTVHSELASKMANAKLHGAAGVLLVNDLPTHKGDEDRLDKFVPVMATQEVGIPAVQITAKIADALLSTQHKSLADVIAGIDQDLKPESFAFPATETTSLNVSLKGEKRATHNVLGWLPGQTSEYVIIGAHYDHLGLGEQDSLAPSQIGSVHPGADDNASGTAGVVELAARLSHGPLHKRGFLFLCFAGEEEGLLGSAYYANHPLLPLNNAVAMINMDMIGRLRNNKVYVGGVGTGSTFKPIVEKAAKAEGLQMDASEAGGYGASDHTSFTAKRVPTLFFFSGLHSDYHKPSDTWEKINTKDAVRLLDEVALVADALADAPERPAFVRVQPSPHSGDMPSSSSGYGPYFGSIPDFGGPANGVRFSDVKDGSPAAKAGLKAGDVLVEFDGKPIQNLYDFTYALRAHKPGDNVPVKVLRDNKELRVQVLLTKRP
jgi:hypothetical protein